MTVEVGAFLVLLCSVLTGLVTEAWKNMVGDKKYKPNILAAVVSIVIGVAVCTGYVILTDVIFDIRMAVYCIALVGISWLCAMVGYDKVMQTIAQLFKGK